MSVKSILLLPALVLAAGSALAQGAPAPAAPNGADWLLGKHMLSLQWVSWQQFGSARFYRDGDQVRVFGSQEVEGNWVMVNGTVTADPAQQDRFTLSGEVVTRVSYNNHGNACRRTGEFHFVQKPGKKYWRMREIDNPCEAVADYVDIYFK